MLEHLGKDVLSKSAEMEKKAATLYNSILGGLQTTRLRFEHLGNMQRRQRHILHLLQEMTIAEHPDAEKKAAWMKQLADDIAEVDAENAMNRHEMDKWIFPNSNAMMGTLADVRYAILPDQHPHTGGPVEEYSDMALDSSDENRAGTAEVKREPMDDDMEAPEPLGTEIEDTEVMPGRVAELMMEVTIPLALSQTHMQSPSPSATSAPPQQVPETISQQSSALSSAPSAGIVKYSSSPESSKDKATSAHHPMSIDPPTLNIIEATPQNSQEEETSATATLAVPPPATTRAARARSRSPIPELTIITRSRTRSADPDAALTPVVLEVPGQSHVSRSNSPATDTTGRMKRKSPAEDDIPGDDEAPAAKKRKDQRH